MSTSDRKYVAYSPGRIFSTGLHLRLATLLIRNGRYLRPVDALCCNIKTFDEAVWKGVAAPSTTHTFNAKDVRQAFVDWLRTAKMDTFAVCMSQGHEPTSMDSLLDELTSYPEQDLNPSLQKLFLQHMKVEVRRWRPGRPISQLMRPWYPSANSVPVVELVFHAAFEDSTPKSGGHLAWYHPAPCVLLPAPHLAY